jgi:hypothetical protein
MSNWWRDNTGRNTLKGVPGDDTNRPILEPGEIVYFLGTVPQARFDYLRLFPTMLPEEQARLNEILDRHPFVKTKLLEDPQTNADKFSQRLNKGPIRTSGRLGGTGIF